MRALVLAAGWGTRLGPAFAGRPKPLLPVGDRTPLDFAVDALDAVADVAAIDVVTHEAFLPEFERWAAARRSRATLHVSSNGTRTPEERLGAVGDLGRHLARSRPREALLVLGGDMVFDFDLTPLAALAEREVAIVVYDVGSPEQVCRYASVAFDGEGRVVRFVEKDPRPSTTLAAPAIYGVPEAALAEVDTYLRGGGHPDNLGFLMQWWVARRPVRAVRAHGRWIDIGSADEYARAQRELGGAAAPAARI
jgi:glucose-1-phosphate thymidylyltransferase